MRKKLINQKMHQRKYIKKQSKKTDIIKNQNSNFLEKVYKYGYIHKDNREYINLQSILLLPFIS